MADEPISQRDRERSGHSAMQPRVLVTHPGGEMYGSDRVLLSTVQQLCSRDWAVSVALGGVGPLADLLVASGATVYIQPTPVLRKNILSLRGMVSYLLTAVRSILPGLSLLAKVDPEVMYVSTVTTPLWAALGFVTGRPVVSHVHEAEVDHPAAMRRVLNAPLLTSKAVIINSRFCESAVSGAWPVLANRLEVILNPIAGPPSNLIANRGKPATSFERSDRLCLLYAGRLSPRKGLDVLLDSVKGLRSRGMDVELRIAGSAFEGYEWYEQTLRSRIATDGLESSVTLIGYVNDIWTEMAVADVVVVPSVEVESFGNVAVEAVLAGRPVVVSDSGALPEAVRGFPSAKVVPSGDPDAIAEAIEKIAADLVTSRDLANRDSAMAAERHDPSRFGTHLASTLLAARG